MKKQLLFMGITIMLSCSMMLPVVAGQVTDDMEVSTSINKDGNKETIIEDKNGNKLTIEDLGDNVDEADVELENPDEENTEDTEDISKVQDQKDNKKNTKEDGKNKNSTDKKDGSEKETSEKSANPFVIVSLMVVLILVGGIFVGVRKRK